MAHQPRFQGKTPFQWSDCHVVAKASEMEKFLSAIKLTMCLAQSRASLPLPPASTVVSLLSRQKEDVGRG
jgi:hypothetical protein